MIDKIVYASLCSINFSYVTLFYSEQTENPFVNLWESQTTNNLSCSYCRMDFPDVGAQREHFKLDWHRFNLKQSLLSRNTISEHEFNKKDDNGKKN